MKTHFDIKPIGFWATLGDILMFPIMWLFVGLREAPQRTHVWNNRRFSPEETSLLDQTHMVMCREDNQAQERGKIQAHLPTWMGGWRNYVVVTPKDFSGTWYIGWMAGDKFAGISLIPLTGSVRVLIGPDPVGFFALDANGVQIPIRKVGEGQIGVRSRFSWMPLR